MNEPLSEKDKLLMMLKEMNNQLDGLHSAVEASFSDLSKSWYQKEEERIIVLDQSISFIEKMDHHNTNNFTVSPLPEQHRAAISF